MNCKQGCGEGDQVLSQVKQKKRIKTKYITDWGLILALSFHPPPLFVDLCSVIKTVIKSPPSNDYI